jgi:hypothetical protein
MKALTKLRISTYDLAIERGRYKGKSRKRELVLNARRGMFLTTCKRFTK